MTNNEYVDVLIIGAGPAGLVIANSLRDRGLKVRIVERRSENQTFGQADGLKYVALEIFDSLSLGGLIQNEIHHVQEISLWESDEKGDIFRFAELPDVVPGLKKRREVTLAQARVEFVLKHHLANSSPVEYSTIPASLEFDGCRDSEHDHPLSITLQKLSSKFNEHSHNESSDSNRTAQYETIRARYVVGCDGTQSWTRSQLGIEVTMDKTDSVWGVADIIPKTDFPDIRKSVTARSRSEGSLLIMPRENKLVRIYVSLGHDSSKSSIGPGSQITCEQIVERAEKILHPYSLKSAHCEWSSTYRVRQQVAKSFSKWNRVFLAGDAVHAHSPKSGQGMNTSIQDAFNLGWKLSACLTWGASPALLGTYETERMPVAQRLIDNDRNYLKLYPTVNDRQTRDLSSKQTTICSEAFTNEYLSALSESANAYLRYEPNLIVRCSNMESSQASHIRQYSSRMAAGERIHDFDMVNQSDGLITSIHKRLVADGRFRLLVFPGNICDSARLQSYQKFGNELQMFLANSGGRYYRHNEHSDSRLEVLTIHTADRRSIELLDLPDVFHPWTEEIGWDYWKVYSALPEDCLHEALGMKPEGDCIVLVRPDGHIAMIADFNSLSQIDEYFAGFLPPSTDKANAGSVKASSKPNGVEVARVSSKPLWLWSHARTASNLFLKILSSHPQLSVLEYPFHDAFMWGPEHQTMRQSRQVKNLRSDVDGAMKLQETYQHAWKRLESNMEDVFAKGQIPLVKEHVYFVTKPDVIRDHLAPDFLRPVRCNPMVVSGDINDNGVNGQPTRVSASTNPTVIADDILRSFRPMFIIRHPILMISSLYRAASKSLGATVDDEDFPMNATYRWLRLLYDWYVSNDGCSATQTEEDAPTTTTSPTWPLIIDASDLISNTQSITTRLIRLANLDEDAHLQYSWEARDPANMRNFMETTFLGTILRSSGVIRPDKSQQEILAAEQARWPEEFGPGVAKALQKYVDDAMVDYSFLHQRRLR